ncbi:MAG: hypothetical protein KDE53_02865 [Caldilineaceae bacterium]|nr:hypothetical protein [Caldilineaceae bacterium]MCB0122208.1 hypothetical protein [Caldilineaceae bacterium]
MQIERVVFPNGQQIDLPAATVAAIAQSSAKYAEPLWYFRAERVLKLGAHQWISPFDQATAQAVLTLHPAGILCTAWKLFNRGWAGAAEAYYLDSATYPDHPRHLGRNVIPLVDEDDKHFDAAQIGWVRIEQSTEMNQRFAIFVQFTLLTLFPPRPLPAPYQ